MLRFVLKISDMQDISYAIPPLHAPAPQVGNCYHHRGCVASVHQGAEGKSPSTAGSQIYNSWDSVIPQSPHALPVRSL